MDSRLSEAVQLTVIGSSFVAVGSLLNSYLPAFHTPVSWVDHALQKTGAQLSRWSATRPLFYNNPLTTNRVLTEFLAVNIAETALTGTLLVGGGVAMKFGGIDCRKIERWLSTNRGDISRS